MLALEYNLVAQFGWSLRDIDETDMMSLIPFVYYAGYRASLEKSNGAEKTPAAKRLAYADEVDL